MVWTFYSYWHYDRLWLYEEKNHHPCPGDLSKTKVRRIEINSVWNPRYLFLNIIFWYWEQGMTRAFDELRQF